MAKKTFTIAFPIYGTGMDRVDIDESLLVDKTDKEIKELLLSKASSPHLCHQCTDSAEELEYDENAAGENLEHVSFWEDEE